MADPQRVEEHRERAVRAIEVTIRLGVVFGLLAWGFLIVAPFLHPLAWGAIVAVALYPAYEALARALGGRPRLAGALFIVAAIAVVIVPASLLAAGSVDGVTELAERWQEGKLRVPPPPAGVQDWPLVGGPLYGAWLEASENLEATIQRFSPQLQTLGSALLGVAASLGGIFLLLTFSLVIAGVLMIHGPGCARFARAFGERLVGDDADEFVTLATRTIRGVAMGVVGTASIQAAAAALGIVLMGIPLAGLWAGLVLVLGVLQLPPLLVLLPLVVWSYSNHGVLPATLFAVWSALVVLSEQVLKPVLMGRGQSVPMLVLLIGSLGGMLLSGVMGLFVGAVVLSVIYRLFDAWLHAGTRAGGASAEAPGSAA